GEGRFLRPHVAASCRGVCQEMYVGEEQSTGDPRGRGSERAMLRKNEAMVSIGSKGPECCGGPRSGRDARRRGEEKELPSIVRAFLLLNITGQLCLIGQIPL